MQILNKKLYKKYNNNGWVKIENLLSRKDVSKINHKINEFIEKKFNFPFQDITTLYYDVVTIVANAILWTVFFLN